MPVGRRAAIVEALRHRILAGLQSGALEAGRRLPSTREAAVDLAADPRVVAAAYRVLAADGMVELRPRSGVFVAGTAMPARRRAPSSSWAVDTLCAAVAHGIPLPAAASQLRTLAQPAELRVVVAAAMSDQVDGLVRELADTFGIAARGVMLDAVSRIDHWPRALERAHLVVTTAAHAQRLRRFHRGPTRPLLVAGIRQDILGPEWRLLVREVACIIIADPRFAAVVRGFLAGAEGGESVAIRIAGRDDLRDIAPDAPVYITEAARNVLGRTRLPGRPIPPARILDDASVRAIVELLVERNVAAAR